MVKEETKRKKLDLGISFSPTWCWGLKGWTKGEKDRRNKNPQSGKRHYRQQGQETGRRRGRCTRTASVSGSGWYQTPQLNLSSWELRHMPPCPASDMSFDTTVSLKSHVYFTNKFNTGEWFLKIPKLKYNAFTIWGSDISLETLTRRSSQKELGAKPNLPPVYL